MPAPEWLQTRTQTLVVQASNRLWTALTTWLREYGVANGLPSRGRGVA
ncbi:MAG: hypothetical protein JO352_23160 [Chloroflexi bacterium]|nr:hypothetical protein [Chloroflexota bacterium]